MPILGIDVSHWQGSPNWAQVKASGRDFAVLKATEGTGYVDQSFASNRRNAHAAGLIVGFYHFAKLGSPAAEAAYFAKTVGPLQPGEFIVLDYEPNPVPPGSAVWSKAWLDATKAALGVAPLVYMNTYTMNFDNWSAVAKDYGLWIAKYDQSTAPVPTKWWPTEAMKQDNDKSLVVGVIGGVDDDVFYGTREQLLAYGYHQGADMPLTDADAAVIWNHVLAQRNGLGPASAAQWLQDTLFHANAADNAAGDMHSWLRGGDPDHDNVFLIWAMLKGLTEQAQAQAPVIDEAKLAAALLADPAAVQALGKAIADNLQLSPRANG